MGEEHTCLDLARLQSIDQKSVLAALKGRHEHGVVYTHAASVGAHSSGSENRGGVMYKVSLAIRGVRKTEPSVHAALADAYAA